MDQQPAALSYVAYDEYVLYEFGGNNQEVAHAYGRPLEDLKQDTKMLVDIGPSAYSGLRSFPGENDTTRMYDISNERSKKISRTLLKALRRNELSSICFSHFDESNILVTPSGKVMFVNIRLRRNLTPAELEDGLKDNYKSARCVIQGLFPAPAPADIEHLLDLIRTDAPGIRCLFHIHGSLVPIATYPSLFRDMYDQLHSVIPGEDLRDILSSLPYVDTWKAAISTNDLLLTPFKYNPKSYVVPADKEKQTCLNNDQRKALADLGLDPQLLRQRSLTPDQIQLIEALQFLDYLRNRGAHRMEPWKEWNRKNEPYSRQGSELVWLARFPLVVPYIQLELHKKNLLHDVPVEEFF